MVVDTVVAAVALVVALPSTLASSKQYKGAIQNTGPAAELEKWQGKLTPIIQCVHLNCDYIPAHSLVEFVANWNMFLNEKGKLQDRMKQQKWRWYWHGALPKTEDWSKDLKTIGLIVFDKGTSISQTAMLHASACKKIHPMATREGTKCLQCAEHNADLTLQDSQYFSEEFWRDVMNKLMEKKKTSPSTTRLSSESPSATPKFSQPSNSDEGSDSSSSRSQDISQMPISFGGSLQVLEADKDVEGDQTTMVAIYRVESLRAPETEGRDNLPLSTASRPETNGKGKEKLRAIEVDSLETRPPVKSFLGLLGTTNQAGPLLASTSSSEPDFGETMDDFGFKTARMFSSMGHMMRDNPQLDVSDMLNALVELEDFKLSRG